MTNLYDYSATLENGEQYSLEKYKGDVVLIVNTATKCGFTPQFDGLEKLYQQYKDQGFTVLGFPSNQFKQELASGKEAAEACRLNYGVTFPMHEVVDVNGEKAAPVFKYVTSHAKGLLGSESVKWNFTKFLVDRDGNVVERFASKDKPESLKKSIEKLL
jgi:glutathione peroxidase